MKTKICSVGECMIEIANTKNNIFQQSFAGDTLNFCNYIDKKYFDVSFLTAIGKTSVNRSVLEFINSKKISTKLIKQVNSHEIGLYLIKNRNNGEKQFFYWRDNSAAKNYFNKIDFLSLFKNLKNFDYIYFSGITLSIIDPSKIRMHICWGNYEGPHTHDIGLNKIIEIAFKANINKYLIESANPRHAHEWEVFENIKLPKDKIIIPGVIESTSNFIEHPDVVKHRILVFSKVIDPSQLMAGTDCGFGTFAGFGNVDENIAYKKLESLVIGSRLASKVI